MDERSLGRVVHLHPLASLHRREDLVYFDGPVLTLFENDDGEPFLFLWCDVNATVNRWLAFRVNEERLAGFLQRRVTLRDLVMRPSDGFVYMVDIVSPPEFQEVRVLLSNEIPEALIPSSESFFDFTPTHTPFDLAALTRRYQTPLLDLHLIRGTGVNYGSSDIITLGSILESTGELAESIAIALFSGKDQGPEKSKTDARAYGQFQYFMKRAASFSAILKPVVAQENLLGFKDRTSEVVGTILHLLRTTPEYSGLQAAATKLADPVIRELEAFVQHVKERNAEVEIRWALPNGSEVISGTVDPTASQRIIDNIHRLEREESQGFWNEGSFLGIDTKLKSYRFRSNAGRESVGKFAPKIAYPLSHISFESEYRVYMTRRILKFSGRSRPQVKEVIGEIRELSRDDDTGDLE